MWNLAFFKKLESRRGAIWEEEREWGMGEGR
jgi:hypothetical protein